MKTRRTVFGLLPLLSGTALAASSGADLTPDDALKPLKDGNARVVAGQSTHSRRSAVRHTETATGGQRPFATIIGCSDSREAHEPAKTESEPRTGRHRY